MAAGLFLLTIFLHIFDLFFTGRLSGTGTNVWLTILLVIGYFIVAIWVYIVYGNNSWKHALLYTIMFLVASFLPWLLKQLFQVAPTSQPLIALIGILIAILPLWPFYLLVWHGNDLHKILRFIGWAWLIFWILSLAVTNITYLPDINQRLGEAGVTSIELPVRPGEAIKIATTNILGGIRKASRVAQEQANESLNLARGDYYTSEVDKNADIDLGVFFENIQTTQKTFRADETVSVIGTIQAQTINELITLTAGCTAKHADATQVPSSFITATPTTPVELASKESINVDCSIAPNSFVKGINTITLTSTFDFKTLSYIPTYIMDKERLRELRQADIDPFEQYNIKDRSPQAIHTAGPVKIGMNLQQPPIGISKNEPTAFNFFVTIDPDWPGHITQLNRIILFSPAGIDLEMQRADLGTLTQITCNAIPYDQSCDESIFNIYEVIPERKTIKDFQTFNIIVRIDPARYDEVLQNTPLATRHFKATAEYTYQIEQSIGVTIQKALPTIVDDAKKVLPLQLVSQNTEVTDTTATITWETSDTSIGEITITSPLFEKGPSSNEFKTKHEVTLTNLLSKTTYTVQIRAQDTQANARTIVTFSFTTT
jgi:hypothetical protein